MKIVIEISIKYKYWWIFLENYKKKCKNSFKLIRKHFLLINMLKCYYLDWDHVNVEIWMKIVRSRQNT